MDVERVRGRRQLYRGLRQLQPAVYREAPGWHRPPLSVQLALLEPRIEPLWRNAARKQWFARQGGRVVGRLLAFVAPHEPRVGRFALFEALDDGAIADALFGAALEWLQRKGCEQVLGPLTFSVHEAVGLLTDGFEHPPSYMMPFNAPHAAAQIERQGFSEVRGYCTYRWSFERDRVPLTEDRKDLAVPAGLSLRMFDIDQRQRESLALLEVYNAAFRDNWGFEPLSHKDCQTMVDQLVQFGDPRLVRIAELDGRAVGFILCVPDPNARLHQTRAWPAPLRLMDVALKIKRKRLESCRVVTLAVLPELRRQGIAHALVRELAASSVGTTYREAELSYIDTDNAAINAMLTGLSFPRHKRYAVYQRQL